MSKEEFLKIQTCVLKVNIHCDGCKQKVKKILQKIDGVYTTNIDSEQGKVTVSGNVDAATLIKKLTKNGKHAEIWGASKGNNNNHNQMNNQFKNLQIDNGSKGGKNKGQAPKGGGNNQPKGGLQVQNPQLQQHLQQLQQLQQLKGLQDLKMPPQFMKDLKVANNNKDQNQKSVRFNLPEDEGLSDDDFDDEDFDDDGEYDDDFDDVDDIPVVHNKMKLPVLANGHGGAQMGNMMMNNIMNGQHPQLMKGGGNGGNNGGNGGGNGKKGGGGGNMPVQMNLGGGNQNPGGANGGKKGGNGNNNGGNQNQGGGKGGKNGGGQPNDGKNGGGGHNKGGGGAGAVNGNNYMGNGAKKGGGVNDGPHGMPNMMAMSAGGNVGPMGTNMQMPQMGNLPMSQMNSLAAVQGLPASAMTGGGGGGAGYFPATTPEHVTANPYYQQQLAAMMMNQQRANGNERFQPMMYARPPPAVNYMPPYPPYPYPHPYGPPQGERIDQYTMFSDENTSSCNVM